MKKTMALAAAVLMASLAQAGVMNWQVSSVPAEGSFTAAQLVARNAGDEVVINDEYGDAYQAVVDGGVDYTVTAEIANLDGYTFYVELGSYAAGSGGFTATQQAVVGDYTTLVQAGIISSSPMTVSGINPVILLGNQFTAVPEPCSATLLLLGFAVAGLKRRRV